MYRVASAFWPLADRDSNAVVIGGCFFGGSLRDNAVTPQWVGILLVR